MNLIYYDAHTNILLLSAHRVDDIFILLCHTYHPNFPLGKSRTASCAVMLMTILLYNCQKSKDDFLVQKICSKTAIYIYNLKN